MLCSTEVKSSAIPIFLNKNFKVPVSLAEGACSSTVVTISTCRPVEQ